MGWLGNLWNKAKSLGSKVARGVQHVGNKILSGAEKVVDVVEKVPVLRDIATPFTETAKAVIGAGRKVTDIAGRGADVLESKTAMGMLKGAMGLKKEGAKSLGDVRATFEKEKAKYT